MEAAYWIKAELSEVRSGYNGHCYVEFVQKDEYSSDIIAKARGQIWSRTWSLLRPYFLRTTGQELAAGMQVLVQVEVTFHELYGYSLNVIDIDPTYTLGDIARHRQEVLNRLRSEGVAEMNRELTLPLLLQRIAVISSPNAAGYGDFCNQLDNAPQSLRFFRKLFPATMQGADTEQSIIQALYSIADDQDSWDAVVIIRGGGSTADLQAFDSLLLAENVAQFPLPVITGIGHERDDTVIDMVAHTRVKTPTAAAEFIIHHQLEQLSCLNDLRTRINTSTVSILNREQARLQNLATKIPAQLNTVLTREANKLDRLIVNISHRTSQHVATELSQLALIQQQLQIHSQTLIRHNQQLLTMYEKQIEASSPDHILRLGFSVTRMNGKAVKDASQLKPGDTIVTTLASGDITSTVCNT